MRGHCKKQREWEEILAGYPSTALVAATSQLSHKTSFSCNFVSTPAPAFCEIEKFLSARPYE